MSQTTINYSKFLHRDSSMNVTYRLQSKLTHQGKVSRRTRIMLGYSCNLRCTFCYYKGLRGFRESKEIEQEIQDLMKAGCTHFDLTGGEPTLHPRFLEIVKFCSQSSKVSCVTNGQKLSDVEFARECTKLSDVLISIHGTKHHDGIVGKDGAFERCIQAVKNCRSLGIRTRVNFTLCNQNYKDIPDFVHLMNDLDVDQVNFIFLNYNDSAQNFEPIALKEIAELLNQNLENLEVPFNIRYVPYCLIQERFRYAVKNYWDHIFDLDDWSPLYSYYDCRELLSDDEIVQRTCAEFDRTLPKLYYKPKSCLSCKDFIRCDGFKNSDALSLKRS